MSKQSRRPNRAARHHKPPTKSTRRSRPSRNVYWVLGLAAVAAIIGASFLTTGKSSNSSSGPLKVGSAAPAVSGRDVVSGREITANDLTGKNVLYYLSEGVLCQACLVQIQALQQHLSNLDGRHLTLISITNDGASTLAQAAAAYKITTPLIADPSRRITRSFGVLGGIPYGVGMHTDTADHTFVLIDKTGKIRFLRDYPRMWIDVNALLEQLPKVN
ncbi:MAG TPA: redoxin domain-containing protein [Gaiellaceae bacterium]|nr:redoxin domain-containing protein [Gaiellaceae bacterium]